MPLVLRAAERAQEHPPARPQRRSSAGPLLRRRLEAAHHAVRRTGRGRRAPSARRGRPHGSRPRAAARRPPPAAARSPPARCRPRSPRGPAPRARARCGHRRPPRRAPARPAGVAASRTRNGSGAPGRTRRSPPARLPARQVGRAHRPASLGSSQALSCDSGMAPAVRATSRPPSNRIRVGMLRMPNRAAISGTASVSSFATRSRGSSSRAACGQHRRHRLARPAPRRPEVHQQRNPVLLDMPVEAGGAGQVDRLPLEQPGLAAAALRGRRRPLARYPVHRPAGRADQMKARRHGTRPRL